MSETFKGAAIDEYDTPNAASAEKLCANCDKPIAKPRSNQKYCPGGICRNAAWRSDHPRRKRPVRKPSRRRGTFMEHVIFEGLLGMV